MKFNQPPKLDHQYEIGLIAEECGEVNQIIGKIMRFGLDSCNPITGESNTELLHQEIGDIQAAIEYACEKGILNSEILETRKNKKIAHHRNTAPLL